MKRRRNLVWLSEDFFLFFLIHLEFIEKIENIKNSPMLKVKDCFWKMQFAWTKNKSRIREESWVRVRTHRVTTSISANEKKKKSCLIVRRYFSFILNHVPIRIQVICSIFVNIGKRYHLKYGICTWEINKNIYLSWIYKKVFGRSSCFRRKMKNLL